MERRDLYTKHYRNDDGSFTAVMSAVPVHYPDHGSFKEIDHNITTNTNPKHSTYAYANTANLMKTYFSDRSSGGLLSISNEGQIKEFLNTNMYWEKAGLPLTALTSADVSGLLKDNEITYKNIYPSIDAQYAISTGRRELNYIIHDKTFINTAPVDADYLVFSEDIEIDPSWSYEADKGGLRIKDSQGNLVGIYENPLVKEDFGSKGAADYLPMADNTIADMTAKRTNNIITIFTRVSKKWLTDSNRKFPIAIDPTFTQATPVQRGYTNQNGTDAAYNSVYFGRLSNLWYLGYCSYNLATWNTLSWTATGVSITLAGSASGTFNTASTMSLQRVTFNPDDYGTWAAYYTAQDGMAAYNVYPRGSWTGAKDLGAPAVARFNEDLATSYKKFTVGFRATGTWTNGTYWQVTGFTLNVTYTDCTPANPTSITPAANGGTGTVSVPVNTSATLTVPTITGGTNCGSWLYAWSNNGGAANSWWNGSSFIGATASYLAGYSSIAPTVSTNTTFTAYVQATGGSTPGTSGAVTVNVVTPPTLTAKADGSTSLTIANNVSVTLTANPTGGSGCTGTTEYAWRSGAGGNDYWNGTDFTGNNTNYSSSYSSITTPNLTVGRTFTVLSRCSNVVNATSTSSVTVSIGTCVGPTLTAQANGGTGTVTAAPGANVNLTANSSGGNYCDGNGAWVYAWRSGAGGNDYWNGTDFTGDNSNYSSTYSSIDFTASASGTTTYTAYAQCANNAGCVSIPNSVNVQATLSCAAPVLVPTADETTGETVPNNSNVVLKANPGGGANCSGSFVYAWRSGAGGNDYWNGTDFTGDNTNYSTSYDSITVTGLTTSRTFQALVKCDADAGCNDSGSVMVNIGTCSAPTLTARANGSTGTVTVPSGDGVALTANPTGGTYCDAGAPFLYAWSYDATHWWDGSDFNSSTAVYSAGYATINPASITTNRTYTASVQCATNSSCSNTSSVTVNAGACTAPTLTARANGTVTSVTVSSGSTAVLTANPSGGSNCAGGGTFEYAWTDGSGWFNGTDFSGSTAAYSTSYSSINATNILASKNYTVYSRCAGNTSCTSSSSVLIYIISTVFTENFSSGQNGWTAGAYISNPYDFFTISANTGNNANYTVDGSTNLQIACSGCSPVNTNYSATTFDIYIYKYLPISASSMTLSFQWIAKGEFDGTTRYDYGQVGYSTDGVNFTWMGATPGSTNHGDAGTGKYCTVTGTNAYPAKTATIPLPSALDNAPFYLGFRFISDANTGARPPFIIDNISITAAQPLGTAISSVSLLNSGGTDQICFNNSRINTASPLFRVSAASSGNFDSYQIEVNTNSTFTGTSYVQTYSGGTYANNTAYNLSFNGSTPSFSPSSGTVYYVRARASGNNGTTWSAWTSAQHSFVYDNSVTSTEWYQKAQPQFQDAGYASNSLTAAANNIQFSTFTGGSNPFTDPGLNTGTGWSKTYSPYVDGGTPIYNTFITTDDNGTNGKTEGSGLAKFSEDNYSWQSFVNGEFGGIYQQVNLTGVTNLTWDATVWRNTQSNVWECGIGRSCRIVYGFQVIIGDAGGISDKSGTVVYTRQPTTAELPEFGVKQYLNETVDISSYGFTGNKYVKFIKIVTNGGGVWYDDEKWYLDNIRTSSTAPTTGTWTSAPAYLASINGALNWSTLKWNQTLNGGTITFKIQKFSGGSWSDVAGLTNLSASGDGDKSVSIATSSDAQIRMVMTMTQSGTSPVLNNWALTAESCTAPTVTAKANNVATSTTVSAGATVNLTANETGGVNCSDYYEFAWSDGTNYWNGSAFASGSAVYSASYNNISFSASATKTYTLTVRCHASVNCVNTSQVIVNVATVPAAISAVIGTPANGTEHHLTVSWDAAAGATAYGLEYSTNGSSWNTIGDVGGTTYDYNAGDNPNAPYYFRVRSKIGSVYSDYATMITPRYTACDIPALPTLGSPGNNVIPVTITTETPVANPAITLYSIFCSTTGQYVQADGTLGATEVYRTKAQWGTTNVSGLSVSTTYCFYVKAQNADGDVRFQAATALLATQTFSSDVINNASAPPTSGWGSPGTCGSGGYFDYNATAGCSGGGGAKFTLMTDNFSLGCFLRSPIVNCTGQSTVTLSFDLTNHQDAGDNFGISCWSVGDNKYGGSLTTVNGVAASNVTFSTARNCAHMDLVFSLSGITDRSQLMFYIDNNGDNDFGAYNLVIDNYSINTAVPTACATTTNTSCTAPTLNAMVNGSHTPSVVCAGTELTLTANPTGGSGCSGGSEYTWFNGTGYWDGSSFSLPVAVYNTAYSSITTTASASATYAVVVRCIALPSCNGMSEVSLTVNQLTTWYQDNDGDNYGNAAVTTTACAQPTGYVANSTDCDDNNANVNPGQAEACNNSIDDNCNSQVDEGCPVMLNVKAYIQGYYLGSGKMSPLLKLLGMTNDPTLVDTITVELHNSTSPFATAYSVKGVLKTDGTVAVGFPVDASGNNYYVVVKHRNSLDTWSANYIQMTGGTTYDFTTAQDKAYNNGAADLGGGTWGLFSGDVNGDGIINAADKSALQATLSTSFQIGVYHVKDVSGDGFVDEDDLQVLQNNPSVSIQHP